MRARNSVPNQGVPWTQRREYAQESTDVASLALRSVQGSASVGVGAFPRQDEARPTTNQ